MDPEYIREWSKQMGVSGRPMKEEDFSLGEKGRRLLSDGEEKKTISW